MSPLYIALSLAALAVLVLGLVLMRRLWLARRQWFAVGALRVVTVDGVLPAVFVITTRGRDGVWLYSLTDERSYPVTWGELGGGVFDRINGSHPSRKRIEETGATEPTFCYCWGSNRRPEQRGAGDVIGGTARSHPACLLRRKEKRPPDRP